MAWKRSEHRGWEYTSRSGRHWVYVLPINEWREWLPPTRREYNWRNFHLVVLHVEHAPYSAGWEFDLVLLGLGFHLRYTDQLMFETTEVAGRMSELRRRLEMEEPEDWRDMEE